MKRVIFVGGTEFSGSTFFHMILANDPAGFALGEAHNFLRPSREHHFNMLCSCGENPCSVWQAVQSAGERHLYQSIFDRFPDVEFIVDSSKNPFWIRDQMAFLNGQNIASQNILMWKTPFEFAHSYNKRGNVDAWEASWVTYHRVYQTFFDDWGAIRYADFVQNRTALETVCNFLNIAYFPDKEQYWNKTHHVIGGNPSARVHLYADDSEAYEENVRRSSSKIEASEKGVHQSIYYEAELNDALRNKVENRVHENPYIAPILDMLAGRDILTPSGTYSSGQLKISYLPLKLRRIKYTLPRKIAGLRYGKVGW